MDRAIGKRTYEARLGLGNEDVGEAPTAIAAIPAGLPACRKFPRPTLTYSAITPRKGE